MTHGVPPLLFRRAGKGTPPVGRRRSNRFFPHIPYRRLQLKVDTNRNRKKSKFSTQQKQYSFSGSCGGRNHLKRRSLAACRGPSASSHFLGCAPKSLFRAVLKGVGNSQEFPTPIFLHFSEFCGRGMGRDVATLPPLPNAPKRRVVAARRASKPWNGGRGGSRLRYAAGTNA